MANVHLKWLKLKLWIELCMTVSLAGQEGLSKIVIEGDAISPFWSLCQNAHKFLVSLMPWEIDAQVIGQAHNQGFV